MKIKLIILLIITTLTFSIQAAALNPELILDIKVKPALVRINSIIVIEYSYTDQNGILKKQNFFHGRVGSGVLINSLGNIVLSSHLVEPVHNFENDFESFLTKIKPEIIKQISAEENLPKDSTKNINQWIKAKNFTLLNKRALKTVVLSNKSSFPYQIIKYSPGNSAEEVPLSILKIEAENLPVLNFCNNTKPGSVLYFYNIECPDEYPELIKYYTDPGHSFNINKSTISLNNISEITNKEDYSRAIVNLVKKTGGSGVFITREGKIKGLLSGLDKKIYIPDILITKQLGELNIIFNQEGSFNKAINRFLEQADSNDWVNADKSLKTASGYFANYEEFTTLSALVDKMKKKSKGKLQETFEKYKLFIVIFGILILAFILYLIILKSKKNARSMKGSTTLPDLPEEIIVNSDLTIPDILQKDGSIARIDILINDELDNTYQLSEGETRIGRDPSLSDIIISELIVSKIHCTIYSKKDGLYIKDQKSTNGVYIDGFRIEESKISKENKITLGKKGKVKIILK